MFWEMYQQTQIHDAQSRASRAEGKAERVHLQIDRLEEKLDSLALICQSMWELMSESLPDAEQQLAAKIEEVDLRDGQLDGKLGRVETHCPGCQRPLHQRHRRCMYCGDETRRENLFQN